MAIYRFDKFEFDTCSYTLRADDRSIPLRPKTAVLMAVLIEQRQHLLGKQALFTQVWQSDHVQHQSLFQAVSEIRKTLSPLQPIKTHPNLGYQWVAPVKQKRERRWPVQLATAILPLTAVSALLIWYGQTNTQVIDSPLASVNNQAMLQSPAMQAFTEGIEHLNKQQLTEAWDSFELAELENPLFLEASLMKAEILFEQADYIAARALTSELRKRAIARGEYYIEVTAQGLLSRISEQTGQWKNALDWALKADSNARNQGFACVAENTRIRLADLISATDQPVNESGVSTPSELSEALTLDYPDASHCESLREHPEADPTSPDLSQCPDVPRGHQRLAINRPPVSTNRRWI